MSTTTPPNAGDPVGGASDPTQPSGGSSSEPAHAAHRWQAVIVALIAGVATVVAAVIATSGNSGNGETGVATNRRSTKPPEVTISSWTEGFIKPPAKRYVFSGNVNNLPPAAGVFVVVQAPREGYDPVEADVAGAEWLVSPEADVLKGNHWKIEWTLDHPPTSGQWVAVVVNKAAADCTPPLCPLGVPRDSLAKYGPLSKKVYTFTIREEEPGPTPSSELTY